MTERLYDCMTEQLYDCMTERLYDCMTERLYDCMTERARRRHSEGGAATGLHRPHSGPGEGAPGSHDPEIPPSAPGNTDCAC